MSTEKNSTIEFKSNLFPVAADAILHDELFLHSLRDPLALQEFNERAYRYHPSPLQREILDKGVGVKCTYADTGDLAWGTIREDGEERVVCLCENYACRLFAECRPGISKPADESLTPAGEGIGLTVDREEIFAGSIGAGEGENLSDLLSDEPIDEQLEPEEAGTTLFFSEDEGPDSSVTQLERPSAEGDANSGIDEDKPHEIAENKVEESGDYAFEAEGVAGRYDEHQAAIVCAEPSRRMYVNAGPGAGKTHTLIEKVKHLMEAQGIEPDRITVLSFTRAAVSVVQNRLKLAAEKGQIHAMWQDVDVTTFDKLCTRILYYVAGESGDEGDRKRISKLDYDQRIVWAKNLIASDHGLMSGCDHLIVDETQDLVGPRADLVIEMINALPESCGFTLFGDRCQSIYEYLVKDGGTTSGEFFSQVCERFAPHQVYLEKNYRQKPGYPLDLSDLRTALLGDDAESASELIKIAAQSLGTPSVAMRLLEPDVIRRELDRGGMGVLTRKNDEALEIESLFWKLGVPAVQARSDARERLSRCLADAFIGSRGETISRDEFEGLIAGNDPYGDGRIWRALISLEGVRLEGDRLRISRALAALNGAVLPPALLATRKNQEAVTVSTVHASKGREFDTVWMLAENLEAFGEAPALEEKRVAYVGLTRGAGDLSLQCLDEHYLIGGKNSFKTYKMLNRDRLFRKRSSGKGRTGKSRVVNIEIRNEIDIEETSFRQSGKLQEALASGLLEGEPIRLVLRGSGERVHYDIVLQDDESFVLGRLTRTFIDDYRKCSGHPEAALPDAFDQIYIDRITTCVGRSTSDTTCDMTFDDLAVWYGFAIGGYAHRDDSQGY